MHYTMYSNRRVPFFLGECPNLNNVSRHANPYAAGGLFGQFKMMQKPFKMAETLTLGYLSESAQQEVSNEYQHDRV